MAALAAMRSGAPAAARAAGLGSDFSGHSGRVGMTRNGAPSKSADPLAAA